MPQPTSANTRCAPHAQELDRLALSFAFKVLRDEVQPSVQAALQRAQATARRSDRDDDDTV